MFGSRRGRTVIGDGLKILGNVTADGLVEVNGQIEGDLHCTALIVSPKAKIVGSITAERVVVNGKVEGPIQGGDVLLKSQAHVVGDIHHQSLTIEKGAYFDGRAKQAHGANGRNPRELREGPFERPATLRLRLSKFRRAIVYGVASTKAHHPSSSDDERRLLWRKLSGVSVRRRAGVLVILVIRFGRFVDLLTHLFTDLLDGGAERRTNVVPVDKVAPVDSGSR